MICFLHQIFPLHTSHFRPSIKSHTHCVYVVAVVVPFNRSNTFCVVYGGHILCTTTIANTKYQKHATCRETVQTEEYLMILCQKGYIGIRVYFELNTQQ